MTPEQRLDRAERILVMLATAGRRTRKEWREQLQAQAREQREQSREQTEKINILIQTQLEIEEIMKRSAARHDKEMAEIRAGQAELNESQKLTDKALQAFIKSLHKGRNGSS